MQKVHRLFIFMALIGFLSAPARAGDFSRDGWYAGLNYAQGFNFITEAIDTRTGGKLDTKGTWGFDMRGGYRFFSWFALEANYEYMNAFKTDGFLGSTDIRSSTITVGPKFLLPFWRVQPYFLLGFGAQHANLDFNSDRPLLIDDGSGGGWNGAIRPALGLDIYATPHLVVNVELASVLVAGKFENKEMSFSDPIYLSIGGGLQYRF